MDIKKELDIWLEALKDYKTPKINELPDIDLYMDQVLTYMDKQMKPFMRDENDKLITSSMINNYVKANIIPNPVSKKYSNRHMAYILAICSLKQILPIADLAKLIGNEDFNDIYEKFISAQDLAINSASNKVKKNNPGAVDDDSLRALAINLAVEANASKMIAEKIIFLLNQKHNEEIEKLREKTIILEKETNPKKK